MDGNGWGWEQRGGVQEEWGVGGGERERVGLRIGAVSPTCGVFKE